MISSKTITVKGATESVYLFGDWPNMDDGATFIHRLKTTVVRSLTGRESRWPEWACIRSSVSYLYDLSDVAAADVRTMLYELGVKRSLVPLWLDYRLASDWANRFYEPQYVLEVETGTVVAAADVGTITATNHVVPLILCRFERPEVEVHDIDFGSFPFTFNEQSPWDWRCDVRDRSLSDSIFPIMPDYAKMTDMSRDRLEFDELGSSREPVVYGDEAPMRWAQDASFTVDQDELGDMLSFFAHNARGRWHSFPVDQIFKPHEQASAGTPDGYMSRLAEDEITLQMYEVQAAETQLRFWHVPWELNPPAGEEFECSQVHWLYEFEWIIPDGTTVYSRFTSSEHDITATIGGISRAFTAAAIEHSKLKTSLSGDMGTVTISMGASPDNPLVPWYRREGEGRLMLKLYRGEGDNPTGIMEFSGEIGDVSLDRSIYSTDFGEPKRNKAPRVVMQRKDNHGFFDGGFSTENYKKLGQIVNIASTRIHIDLTSGTVTGKELAGGLLRMGTGQTYEPRTILDHGDGGVTSDIYIDIVRPLVHASVGDSVSLYPFYDRSFSAARSFNANNGSFHFLGFPDLPVTDPSMENGTPVAKYQGKK